MKTKALYVSVDGGESVPAHEIFYRLLSQNPELAIAFNS
jgi:hypothetical protein